MLDFMQQRDIRSVAGREDDRNVWLNLLRQRKRAHSRPIFYAVKSAYRNQWGARGVKNLEGVCWKLEESNYRSQRL
jgi:hypothetical protein